MAKGKFYVVWVGNKTGVFASWPECQAQVSGVQDAKFKSFETKELAEKAFQDGWRSHWGTGGGSKASASGTVKTKSSVKQPVLFQEEAASIDYDSISVDVGTRGNPGPVEYKGVDTQTGEILFYVGPIPNGTNNLGEFIAVVHALSYLKEKGCTKTIYSDSKTALSWLRNKKVASTLKRDASTAKIWELTDEAVKWLHTNTYTTKVMKWNTEEWGEIKADFGRK
ncbi:ribonuclease H family protein [Paenibacillus sp. GSMTC-2017]|uniref:ribonuclease H n=1 Tax=Paenibacillus sp. GSMTC-2017 TaxID=2794350 RepID=UPI0018D93D58|nr:ribonuclease H family protein [Paenibacillus sp. GSMTC-2017]MBH5320279.1 ribonuclease H family protein [Paenibacillus sp. GSMTC-2017]